MKKINLLAVALLFTMTAKANNNPAINEACEARKTRNACVKNAFTGSQMLICATNSLDKALDLYEKYNYNESVSYNTDDTEGVFSYSITSKPPASSDVAYSLPIQIDPSCNKLRNLTIKLNDDLTAIDNKRFKTKKQKTKLILKEVEKYKEPAKLYQRICITTMNNKKSQLQDCH